MVKLVDYEAVQEGDKFTFIKALMDDGSIDPRLGKNGPYAISTVSCNDEISISYSEDLSAEQTSVMLKQFMQEYF